MNNVKKIKQAFAARLFQLADMSAVMKARLDVSEVKGNSKIVAPASHCGAGSKD